MTLRELWNPLGVTLRGTRKCLTLIEVQLSGKHLTLLRGLPFIPYIDALDTLKRHVDGPFMMPIVDKYSEMGTVLIGKVRLYQIRK